MDKDTPGQHKIAEIHLASIATEKWMSVYDGENGAFSAGACLRMLLTPVLVSCCRLGETKQEEEKDPVYHCGLY